MKTWIDDILETEYAFVKVLKSNETTEVIVYRHKETGKEIVKKVFEGKGDVYRVLQRISHKNLPRVFDVVEEDGKCQIIEEYINGSTIADILLADKYNDKSVRAVGREICDGLTALHSKNIIHRDIKPENIMIAGNGVVKIIDYSAARIYNPFAINDTVILGTVNYAAPEQFGIAQSDMRTDIFALGVTLNVMLTGDAPAKVLYDGKIRKVITKCFMNNPEQRYQSAEKLKRAL